jgi:uncharacterized protein DUF5329
VPLRTVLLAVLLSIGATAGAATTGPTAQTEIAHLLSYLESSGCQFYRNGTWYDARDARAHVEKKLRYLASRSQIGSAEDFIDRAAAASSVSGEKYLVRCGADPPLASGGWLRAELERFRATHPQPSPTP